MSREILEFVIQEIFKTHFVRNVFKELRAAQASEEQLIRSERLRLLRLEKIVLN